MFSKLFGRYLVEKSVIKEDAYRMILDKQMSVRVKLGTIAVADGLLTEEQVEEINSLQRQLDILAREIEFHLIGDARSLKCLCYLLRQLLGSFELFLKGFLLRILGIALSFVDLGLVLVGIIYHAHRVHSLGGE